MRDEEYDIIIGIHSIAEALHSHQRVPLELVGTREGIDELKKRGGAKFDRLEESAIVVLGPHEVQEMAKRYFHELDYEFSRIPSHVFLKCTPLPLRDLTWLYSKINTRPGLKILALDQVTDVHNGAAIMRTAAFYGVDAIVIASRGNFGRGPTFSRIASGALEHIEVVKCSSLPKAIQKLLDLNVDVIGLSEHATDFDLENSEALATCLVLGAEDEGLSHAILRLLTKKIALKSLGKIKSLNVSVAAAVAMEKIFSKT